MGIFFFKEKRCLLYHSALISFWRIATVRWRKPQTWWGSWPFFPNTLHFYFDRYIHIVRVCAACVCVRVWSMRKIIICWFVPFGPFFFKWMYRRLFRSDCNFVDPPPFFEPIMIHSNSQQYYYTNPCFNSIKKSTFPSLNSSLAPYTLVNKKDAFACRCVQWVTPSLPAKFVWTPSFFVSRLFVLRGTRYLLFSFYKQKNEYIYYRLLQPVIQRKRFIHRYCAASGITYPAKRLVTILVFKGVWMYSGEKKLAHLQNVTE